MREQLIKNFNNETLKGIAEMLSLFYYKNGVLYEKLEQMSKFMLIGA